ncbi:MAG: hypothetical protein ACREDU_09055 [Methylocella sp.]
MDITTQAPSMAKQPQRQTSDTVRSGALQEQAWGQNRRESVGAGSANRRTTRPALCVWTASTQPFFRRREKRISQAAGITGAIDGEALVKAQSTPNVVIAGTHGKPELRLRNIGAMGRRNKSGDDKVKKLD